VAVLWVAELQVFILGNMCMLIVELLTKLQTDIRQQNADKNAAKTLGKVATYTAHKIAT
jgi:hypothetical protein